jgi:hypothetical protein
MRSVVALAIAGCTLSDKQLDQRYRSTEADNKHASASAIASWHSAHATSSDRAFTQVSLFLAEQPRPTAGPVARGHEEPTAVDVAKAHELGLAGSERLVRDPATGLLALLPDDCVEGDSCGCQLSQDYRAFVEPDGHVDVLRVRPIKSVERVHVKECTKGCGTPPQHDPADTPTRLLGLGVATTGELRVFDVPYRHVVIAVQCDKEYNAP